MGKTLNKASARLQTRREAWRSIIDGNKRRDSCADKEGRIRSGGYHEPGSMNAHKGTCAPGKRLS